MIATANTDDPPEESSMFLSVAYLCSRLMESSREMLACIRIQTCYCRYKRSVELEKKLSAAAFILKTWQQNKCNYFENQRRIFKGPVLVIERFLVSVRDQLYEMRRQRLRKEARASAATLIQVRSIKIVAPVYLSCFELLSPFHYLRSFCLGSCKAVDLRKNCFT